MGSSRTSGTRPKSAADRVAQPSFVGQILASTEFRHLYPDPIGDRFAAAFSGFDVQEICGGCSPRRSPGWPHVVSLKPFPEVERVELCYRSAARDGRETFQPFGTVKLELDDVVQHDPMFRIERKGLPGSLFG